MAGPRSTTPRSARRSWRTSSSITGVAGDEAQAAAAGWGGDQVVVATGPDDAFAVAWRLAWDTPEDADEFADAYNSVVSGLGFPASVIRVDEDEVLIAHGSSPDVLRRAIEAASD